MALVAPAATPPAIITRLYRDMTAVLAAPEMVEALHAQGLEMEPMAPDQLRARIVSEIAKWRNLVKVAGIHVEP
jgi:tripartite-type tricarboxylate transporter receptor subunit TctC